MNAIIGLCHFCESHGPKVVFYTYVSKQIDNTTNQSSVETSCPACTSIGSQRFISKEQDSTVYYSRQIMISPSVDLVLKQACMRSLSCEVSLTKHNALIFFGNSLQQEYVLSNTFQLKDTRARGLKRLFSIIVVMKDKLFLLNLTSHFSRHIQSITSQLESLCNNVYDAEQATCSQRVLRLTREKMEVVPPRSLVELTGNSNIFAYLHTQFCFILSSAAKVLHEVSYDKELLSNVCADLYVPQYTFSMLKDYLQDDIFLNVMYCLLVGIQVLVRGESEKCQSIIECMELLLPTKLQNKECIEYVTPNESKLFFCKTSVAVPQPNSSVCRIDIVNEKPIIHWTGKIPEKLPTLLINIMKILNEQELSEATINSQILALREEWRIHAMVLKSIPQSSESVLASMKKSLGIKQQDEELIKYWKEKITTK